MRTQQLHQYLAQPPQAITQACVFPKHNITEHYELVWGLGGGGVSLSLHRDHQYGRKLHPHVLCVSCSNDQNLQSNLRIIQRSVRGFNFCCQFCFKATKYKKYPYLGQNEKLRTLCCLQLLKLKKIKCLYFFILWLVERDMAIFCFRGPFDYYFIMENQENGHIFANKT